MAVTALRHRQMFEHRALLLMLRTVPLISCIPHMIRVEVLEHEADLMIQLDLDKLPR